MIVLLKTRVLLAFAAIFSTCLFQVRADDTPRYIVGGCVNSTQGLAFDGIVSGYEFPFSGDKHYVAL